jgi:hypothetical protein
MARRFLCIKSPPSGVSRPFWRRNMLTNSSFGGDYICPQEGALNGVRAGRACTEGGDHETAAVEKLSGRI